MQPVYNSGSQEGKPSLYSVRPFSRKGRGRKGQGPCSQVFYEYADVQERLIRFLENVEIEIDCLPVSVQTERPELPRHRIDRVGRSAISAIFGSSAAIIFFFA